MANRNNRDRRPAPDLQRRSSERAQVDRDDEDYEYEPSAVDAQESEAVGHYVVTPLLGEDIRVIPPGAWRQSWQRQLAQGMTDLFAEKVIHPDDLEIYQDIDPTNDEFGHFVSEAARLSGESLGKSRGPGTSSRRTRRR
ncbi:hypothetical protein [Streptomyces virginiae]|uniref:hypothetical protein n=1 Tax=Streptomyces virginiae TaxID=1961 RepID=UPI00225B4436|nr:hypothetical protein [Streptomyces virginiae]MCX5176710.1 hypothetical protein [Streptomyces virginiae]